MRLVHQVTADGFFVEDVILKDGEACPADCVPVRPINQVDYTHWPKWTGSRGDNAQGSWSEGGGLYRREPDGSVDPSKRYEPITRHDGTRVQRGVDGVITELAKL